MDARADDLLSMASGSQPPTATGAAESGEAAQGRGANAAIILDEHENQID